MLFWKRGQRTFGMFKNSERTFYKLFLLNACKKSRKLAIVRLLAKRGEMEVVASCCKGLIGRKKLLTRLSKCHIIPSLCC
jgi:hypothetical protein